ELLAVLRPSVEVAGRDVPERTAHAAPLVVAREPSSSEDDLRLGHPLAGTHGRAARTLFAGVVGPAFDDAEAAHRRGYVLEGRPVPAFGEAVVELDVLRHVALALAHVAYASAAPRRDHLGDFDDAFRGALRVRRVVLGHLGIAEDGFEVILGHVAAQLHLGD